MKWSEVQKSPWVNLTCFYDQILWVHDHCFCCFYLTDSFSFFPLFFCFVLRTTLQNVTRASFSDITQNRKISNEQRCAIHLTAFYGSIATTSGSDNNIYPTDHRAFEPSNNQQWKHSICSLISCFITSKPYIFLNPGAPDSYALTQSCLDYKAK